MRILFITSPVEDYLGDGLFHGFRTLFGDECVDFPKAEILYKDCPTEMIQQVRGHGFTLYSGLLEDIPVDRFNIVDKVKRGFFQLVVISDIWRQYGWFVQLRPWLNRRNCIVLDGADTAGTYPAAGLWWRRPYYWFLPRAHREFLYFKREWTSETRFSIFSRLMNSWVSSQLPFAKNLRKISFSIPEEKICKVLPAKTKLFTNHIVDAELAESVEGSSTSYAFTDEASYYDDIRDSKFGITTKRAGWDCLRHYEIAANGAVLCFRDLRLKPATCAPHGLNDHNCVSYNNAGDLLSQIRELGDQRYHALQDGTQNWVRANTTKKRAAETLEAVGVDGK
jgi:hypothetical protein